jgi:hypothetical protein
MRILDRGFAWLLLVGGLLHGYGSFDGYGDQPETLVWALSGVLAAVVIAVMNLLRTNRPQDRSLALLCLFGSLSWVGVAIGFGRAIGSIADVRVAWHALAALGLAVFSARQLMMREGALSAVGDTNGH